MCCMYDVHRKFFGCGARRGAFRCIQLTAVDGARSEFQRVRPAIGNEICLSQPTAISPCMSQIQGYYLFILPLLHETPCLKNLGVITSFSMLNSTLERCDWANLIFVQVPYTSKMDSWKDGRASLTH